MPINVYKRVDISILVICYASDIMGYDGRTQELSNAPLHMKQDTTSIDKKMCNCVVGCDDIRYQQDRGMAL